MTFDRLWKDGLMSRGSAYEKLAKELDIDPKLCHIKVMDKATASRVPLAALKIKYRS